MSSSVSYINKYNRKDSREATRLETSLAFDIEMDEVAVKGDGLVPTTGTKDGVYPVQTSPISVTTKPLTKGKSVENGQLLDDIVAKMNDTVFVPNANTHTKDVFEQTAKFYNRFKVANPNLALQKGFPHVFFVKPSCNIFDSASASKLRPELESHDLFSYTWNNSPTVVKELSKVNGSKHDFMLTLSNAVASFSLNEEFINSETYGKTYTGYKIAYGKHSVESKTAGEFQVTFNDDKNLNIYQLHRLWVEYISGVYRGEISPTSETIINKILDYTGACYYILTAEDGETVIFWSKYYGVFPTNIPSTQYSWGTGNLIHNTQLDINFRYSFKEDFNPYSIVEFNHNSRVGTYSPSYIPIYDPLLNHVGATWVGAPFIELVKNSSTGLYEYKLRFRKS